MSIQDSVAGSRETTLQRRSAKAFPVREMAFRLLGSEDRREAAFSGVYVGPWGASPVEPAGNRLTTALKWADRTALGLVYAAVLGLPLFAATFLIGLV